MNKPLTTAKAAALKGVTVRRIQQLIKAGTLAAEKDGRDWLIDPKSLEKVKVYGKSGRPRKDKKK